MRSLLGTMMQMQLMYVKTFHLLEVSCCKYRDILEKSNSTALS